MNIKMALVVLAVVFGAVFLFFRTSGHAEYDKKSLSKISYSLTCTSCNATFSYTTAQMEKFVREGKIVEVPMQVRRFPCVKCGKITAVSYPGNPEASRAPKR